MAGFEVTLYGRIWVTPKEKAHRELSRERVLERENRKLKEALATKVLEADFLQGVLRRIEARRQPVSGSGETASTSRSK
jgi:hypothetical protein